MADISHTLIQFENGALVFLGPLSILLYLLGNS